MNKPKVFGIAVLVTLALLVVASGVVFAAGTAHGGPGFFSSQAADESPYWGPMHGRRGSWTSEGGFPPMHEAMEQAVADATGLSVEEIEARLVAGEHLFDIALAAGLDEGEIFGLMAETREAYLTEAFENGWISEARYQWMLEHMDGDAYGPGFGGCHRDDGQGYPLGGRGMGRQGRW
jgi:hypothetical protein